MPPSLKRHQHANRPRKAWATPAAAAANLNSDEQPPGEGDDEPKQESHDDNPDAAPTPVTIATKRARHPRKAPTWCSHPVAEVADESTAHPLEHENQAATTKEPAK